MITIEKPVVVDEERNVHIHLPDAVQPGLHHLVVVVDAEESSLVSNRPVEFDFPSFDSVTVVPGTFRRNEIYGESGR